MEKKPGDRLFFSSLFFFWIIGDRGVCRNTKSPTEPPDPNATRAPVPEQRSTPGTRPEKGRDDQERIGERVV